MKIRFTLGGLMALVVIFIAGHASAMTTLSTKQVEQFINTMPPLNALGAEMKQEGKDEVMQEQMTASMKQGSFTPYATSIGMLKEKFNSDYDKLGKIVKDKGFSSQEEWAGVGDAVMLTYIALRTEKANPNYAASMAQITPEVLAKMPPEAKAQIEQSMKMVEAFKSVPAENKAVLEPMIPQLEQGMGVGAAATPPKP